MRAVTASDTFRRRTQLRLQPLRADTCFASMDLGNPLPILETPQPPPEFR